MFHLAVDKIALNLKYLKEDSEVDDGNGCGDKHGL